MKRALRLLFAWCALGCSDTGRDEVTFPLYLAGSDSSEPFLADGEVSVVLDRADLAFGPLYLCAGTQAGDLCDTARAEWLESAVVDGASASAIHAGQVAGVSGPVRSWMYDLGIASLLTHNEPVALPAAETLGGVSLVITGQAEIDGRSIPFKAEVIVQQQEDTEIGVPVVRKGTNDAFEHELRPDERGLLIRFDARAWVSGVDFRALVAGAACSPDGACAPQRLEPESQGYRSVRNALVAGERPAFEWGFTP